MTEHPTQLRRIVSGGQTGVDRAALDVAIAHELEHGGWCPRGRLAEDGAIPDRYDLRETDSAEYAVRTEMNVVDSDGTLILYDRELKGGTKLTFRLAKKHGRPVTVVDLSTEPSPTDVRQWLQEENIHVLNVAGPRASNAPDITIQAESFLSAVLEGG